MQRKRGEHEFAVSNFIGDDAADNHAETKTGQTGAGDRAELGGIEAVFAAPIIEDAAANAETNAGRQNGSKAGPE